jgi:biopolymer transport protein ExbD
VHEANSIIEVTRDEKIYLNGKQCDLARLIKDLERQTRDVQIVVRADKRVRLDIFLRLVAKLKKRGFSNISVQTEETFDSNP